MNMADTARGLWRRWYILIPGLLVACALTVGAWLLVKPSYHRSATELLIPSSGSFAPNTGNPFLNLDGLNGAADVMVGSLGGDDVAGKIMGDYPNVKVAIGRDPANSGPALLYTVTASSDAESKTVLRLFVGKTDGVLDQLQNDQSIPEKYRVKAISITFDNVSTVDQKTRVTLTALVGIGVTILTILLTAAIDGLLRRRVRPDAPAVDPPGRGARARRP